MKKLHSLKSWYTLADAAARLSLTLDEPITESDVIQLAADGKITVSWFLNGAYSAQQVAVFCDYPRSKYGDVRTEPEYDENGESWGHGLNGIFTLPVDLYPPWGWWLLTFIGKGGESGAFCRPIVIDTDDGSFWAFYDHDNFNSDFMHFPAKDEIVITRKDIEAFEHHIHGLDADTPAAGTDEAATSGASEKGETGAKGKAVPVITPGQVTQNKLRRNNLDPAIDKAIKQAGNMELADVYLELKALAIGEEKPFTGAIEGNALCYTDDNNDPAKLTKNALGKRLKNRQ